MDTFIHNLCDAFRSKAKKIEKSIRRFDHSSKLTQAINSSPVIKPQPITQTLLFTPNAQSL
jgi:hypothetical protein